MKRTCDPARTGISRPVSNVHPVLRESACRQPPTHVTEGLGGVELGVVVDGIEPRPCWISG